MLPQGFEKQSNYTNKGITSLFNRSIYEYDIHSADVSICEYYHLLSKDRIAKLKSSTKQERVVRVGKMQKNESFRLMLKDGFNNIRREFYDANADLENPDIISVKKDAIFTTKPCYNVDFGPVHFEEKNRYNSYLRLSPLEIYCGEERIDVKGIDDEVLDKHIDGMLDLLWKYCKKMETSTKADVLAFLNRTTSEYKRRELPLEYYREFNARSQYIVKHIDATFDEYFDSRKEDLDIEYNLVHVIIPLTLIAL